MGHFSSSFFPAFARGATEVLSPFVLVALVLAWVPWLTDPHWVRTAALGVTFVSLIPMGLALTMARKGRVSDKFIENRTQRHLFYALSLGSMVVGAVAVLVVPASSESRWMVTLAVATLLVVMVINLRVKISIHALIAALTAVVIAASWLHPVAIIAAALVWGTASWSRLYLRRHSFIEVLSGSILGAGVGCLFLWLVAGLPSPTGMPG